MEVRKCKNRQDYCDAFKGSCFQFESISSIQWGAENRTSLAFECSK